ncbi:MAG: sulfotransferase family 2 domain-containing protein [Chloroflexota bacterium]
MNHDEPVIFLHIPKTGGTSAREVIAANFPADRVTLYDAGDWHVVTPMDMTENDFISGHFQFTNLLSAVWADAPVFTFVRHPVNRFLSHYRWIVQETAHPWNKQIRGLSLEEYMAHPNCTTYWDNIHVRFLAGVQGRPVVESDLTVALLNLTKLQFVGVFEHFDDEMRRLFEVLELPAPGALPHRKKTTVARPLISVSMMHRLMERERLDMKLYEFACDLRHEAVGDLIEGNHA